MNGKRRPRMIRYATEGQGQLHTLGLLEQLRCECKGLWGASSKAYFRVDRLLRQLADPNLHDIPGNLPFRLRCGIETNSTFAGSSPHRRVSRLGMLRSMQRCESGSAGRWSYGSISEKRLKGADG
jgi:hypothetical protein